MSERTLLKPWRAVSATAMAVLLALPAQASTPATGAMGAEFVAGFEAFEELPVPAEPSPEAVDLETFEPPVEAEPTTRSLGTGIASYYASKFHGRRTASGEIFDNGALTAAHRTLRFGSMVRVTNPRTGQSVIVRINDRGPFTKGRTIDLSRAAAEEIGIVRAGHGTVELELIEA
ncbi:septal ring lytic transglycosylase RlpA family protein [Erythrobacter sp. SDW2]|uniref:septal ring lytic transglycosylase RlpA family protein n=1 Tax=Erythrobacter sp. SDW2 TaxID=2907154 RepID=UPI001F44E0F3|nr:septal ring lytic transglycosylase RlpA family protein [Erythrobacter sp. SDW2]UIP08124.1 septal ring lytic transglycosylase RlpA family protein [Erythrobacter sp. SDW2]